jgi:probable HAF family extracellular repeat protein
VAAAIGILAGVLSAAVGVQPAGAATVAPFDLSTLPGGFSAADVEGSVLVGSSANRAALYDLAAAAPMIDLGTLEGGTGSWASAMSGSVVVGDATTGSAGTPRHAFAYDLAAADPHLIDLGTLGGTTSHATGVDGTIVVGSASTPGNLSTHAFAYDLAAAEPHMIDLGTLGGPHSSAAAVEGNVVVGTADIPWPGSHAFAYDLAAATPTMVDLGTLGGLNSSAVAIDGGIVVGSSDLPDDGFGLEPERAFALDLGAASPAMIDLGTLGERSSKAAAIDGGIVVGRSYTPDDIASRAFAYDLGAANPAMIAVGPTGGRFTYATAVDDRVVVGFSYRQGRTPLLAFAYDLAAPSPALIDLGSLGGVGSNAFAIDGGLVVGDADDTDGNRHPALWTLEPPATRLVPGSVSIVEGVGWTTVELPVTLTAPVPVTVAAGWATKVVPGAPPGQANDIEDYVPTSGAIVIPPGQTTGTVTITITGDDLPEGDEYIVVAFSNAANAAIGGYWGLGFVTIVDDDQPTVVPGAASVVEGDAGTTVAEVPVTLSSPTDLTVTVPWTTLHAPGAPLVQADPAADYTATSGTVTFAPGQTSAIVTVEVAGDTIAEPDESILVSFHDPTNAKMGGVWGLGAVIVADDDP